MFLPELIEISPLTAPVKAEITVPGSKSITNRALVLAALSPEKTTLKGALWSEDTQVMVDCLGKLGFRVNVDPDRNEAANRTISVQGLGGIIPNAGTKDRPLELFVGNAGTAARFLAALTCLGQGVYRLHGTPRMHERPQADLFHALRQLGYSVETGNNKLPALVHGRGPRAGFCSVSIAESSQFASALMLSAKIGRWEIRITGENADESPYVAMTRQLCARFPEHGGVFQIEPDASSGSYFWAADMALGSNRIKVVHWPDSGWQIDAAFPKFWPLPPVVSRSNDLGDSIMMAIVLAPLAGQPVRFTDLGRLRAQECERVAALRTELGKCGVRVGEQGDTLEVFPSTPHGAVIETYEDHRMAMCFSILGLIIPGIKIRNPVCVKKTFPNFYQKLAASPPGGLGAIICDARTGRPLTEEQLAVF